MNKYGVLGALEPGQSVSWTTELGTMHGTVVGYTTRHPELFYVRVDAKDGTQHTVAQVNLIAA